MTARLQPTLFAASLTCLLAMLANCLLYLPVHELFSRGSIGTLLLAICVLCILLQYALLLGSHEPISRLTTEPADLPRRPDLPEPADLSPPLNVQPLRLVTPAEAAEPVNAEAAEPVNAEAAEPAEPAVPTVAPPVVEQAPVPLDIAASIELIGDRAVWDEIMEAFFEENAQNLLALKEALLLSDQELLVRSAHTIKGGSAEVLAEPLRQVSAEAEELARQGDFTAVAALLGRLEAEHEKVERHVQAFLRQDG